MLYFRAASPGTFVISYDPYPVFTDVESGGMRIREDRLFSSQEEAEAALKPVPVAVEDPIPQREISQLPRIRPKYRTPWE